MRILMMILLVIMTSGCTNNMSEANEQPIIKENPTATEILEEDSDADIFQHNGLIYINVSEQEERSGNTYQKGKQIAKIKQKSKDCSLFRDGTASKLTVGTEVYQVVGEGLYILLIEDGEEDLIYMAMLEEEAFHHR